MIAIIQMAKGFPEGEQQHNRQPLMKWITAVSLAEAAQKRSVCDAGSVTQQQLTVDYRSGTVFLLNNLDTQAEGKLHAVCRALTF